MNQLEKQLEARFLAIQDLLDVISIFGLFILVMMIIEFIWDRRTGKNRSWAESAANVFIAVGNTLIELTAIGGILFITLYFFEQFALLSIKWSPLSWFFAILAADFTYYWMHRIEHEVRLFWSFHSVHHSSPEFNLSTGMRLAWVESLFEWVFLVPMVLIGFDLVQTIGAFLIVVSYQSWIHTEKITSLGWLDTFFNTPSPHRVHHGRNQIYLDKNYGGILLVWDHLFGTYQKELQPVDYGLVKQIETANPITINFHETAMIWQDLKNSKSPGEMLHHLFGKPGGVSDRATDKGNSPDKTTSHTSPKTRK